MKQTHWTMLGSLLLVLGVLLAFAPTLSAQEENTSRQNRAPHRGLLEVAADELGMTRAALVAELEQNRSIAEVATEQGVAPTTIIDAALVQPTEQMQQAVADGRMTQEEADARLAEHRTRITTAVNTPGLPQRPERAPRGPHPRGQQGNDGMRGEEQGFEQGTRQQHGRATPDA